MASIAYVILTAYSMMLMPCHKFPGISLLDAQVFGVQREQARAIWEYSCRHYDYHRDYIKNNYRVNGWIEWDKQCCESRRIWSKLDDVVYHVSPKTKDDILEHLSDLRKMLGDEKYYSGVMPHPVPYWMFRDD